jgi:hypothetical protein
MIKNRIGRSAALCGLALGILALEVFKASAQDMEGAPPNPDRQLTEESLPAQVITQGWPEFSRTISAVIIDKYGQPDTYAYDSLTWYDKGPWKRIIVHRDGYQRQSLARPDAVLEQVVRHRVPPGKLKDLHLFDPLLVADLTWNELSVRSESEQVNFLTLNLADEIIAGVKSGDEARRTYAQMSELAKSGKSSPYMKGLRFQAAK